MITNDICYTPLDVSNAPDYSIDDVKTWITENTETLQKCVDDLCKRGLSSLDNSGIHFFVYVPVWS